MAPLKKTSLAHSTVLTIETFDGFEYTAKIGAKQDDNYPVTFTVSANLPAERPAPKDAKPAEKAKLDQAFKAEHDRLTAKLAKEKTYEGWVYYLPTYSVDELLKTRAQLLEKPKKAVSTATTKKSGP